VLIIQGWIPLLVKSVEFITWITNQGFPLGVEKTIRFYKDVLIGFSVLLHLTFKETSKGCSYGQESCVMDRWTVFMQEIYLDIIRTCLKKKKEKKTMFWCNESFTGLKFLYSFILRSNDIYSIHIIQSYFGWKFSRVFWHPKA